MEILERIQPKFSSIFQVFTNFTKYKKNVKLDFSKFFCPEKILLKQDVFETFLLI